MRKQRNAGQTERLCFALTLLLTGILTAFFAIRADSAANLSRQLLQNQRHGALLELTERTERICASLAELNCCVSAERTAELYLTLTADAATAQTCAISVPMEDSLSRGILHFLAMCKSTPSKSEVPAQLKYGQELLVTLKAALLCPNDSLYLSADRLAEPEKALTVDSRTYDPDNGISPGEARSRALRFFGTSLSLKRDREGEETAWYRFSCENGFCDISRADGSLIRLAVYREPHDTDCDCTDINRSVTRFFQKADISSVLPLGTEVREGLQYREYSINGERFLLCLSSSTARPAAFFRLPQSSSTD